MVPSDPNLSGTGFTIDFKNSSNEHYHLDKIIMSVWIFCFLNSLVSGDLSDSRILIFFSCILFMYFEINRSKRG